MQKEQLKHPIKTLKEKSREEKQKIKKLVIKKKDDFLTALEKNWRDWAMQPLTKLFHKIGITANQITYAGFILIGIAVWMYSRQIDFKWQLLILILAGISDAIDGPTARNNNNVTVLGTWLDHTRDGVLMIWASYLVYRYDLLSLELLLIIWALQLLLVWITLKDFLISYLKELPSDEQEKFVIHFSLDNLQASVIGRLQFFCWTVGYLALLLSPLTQNPLLLTIGQALIFLEILFAALNILESYQKVLPK